MKNLNVNLTAGNAQLIYLLQDEICVWGKGMTFNEAMQNYKKAKGRKAPKRQTLSVYLCLQPLTQEEAFSEIRFDWVTQVYSTEKVILLQNSIV